MRLGALTIAFSILGCAPALQPAPRSTQPPIADAQQMMMLVTQARLDAQSSCSALAGWQPGQEEERAIGHLYLDGVTEKDPRKLTEGGRNAVTAHVALVGRTLARFSPRPDLPWVFGVLESDKAQASSAPGGYVFVTTGLLKKMTNEAQLAGVLAHEIGHVVHKDSLKLYLDTKHRQCLAAKEAAYLLERSGQGSPAVAQLAKSLPSETSGDNSSFGKFVQNATLSISMMGSDKTVEFDNDKSALELLSFTGYDAVEYERFLITWEQPNHPRAAERVEKLAALRKGELKDFATGTAKPDLKTPFAPLTP